MALPARDKIKIAVVGLGYVGLPLAVYLSRHFPVVGFDIDPSRIEQLRTSVDRTRELTAEELTASSRITYSADTNALNTNETASTNPSEITIEKEISLFSNNFHHTL